MQAWRWTLASPTVPELWGSRGTPCQSTHLPPATAPSPSLSWDGLDDSKEGKKGADHLLGPTRSDVGWGLQWLSAAKIPWPSVSFGRQKSLQPSTQGREGERVSIRRGLPFIETVWKATLAHLWRYLESKLGHSQLLPAWW